MFTYEAEVLDVVDGDTLKLMIDLGFFIHQKTTVRLARINTPETVEFTVQGIKDPAKEHVINAIGPGSICVAMISKPDKYGRWLAEIIYLKGERNREMIELHGKSLNQELLDLGLAKPYR